MLFEKTLRDGYLGARTAWRPGSFLDIVKKHAKRPTRKNRASSSVEEQRKAECYCPTVTWGFPS